MATWDDHEARISALEASHADYRAVLAAFNALGANQREHSIRLTAVEGGLSDVKAELVTVNAHLRSVDEHLTEIRDLIVGGRGRN